MYKELSLMSAKELHDLSSNELNNRLLSCSESDKKLILALLAKKFLKCGGGYRNSLRKKLS